MPLGHVAKVGVEGSNPFARSSQIEQLCVCTAGMYNCSSVRPASALVVDAVCREVVSPSLETRHVPTGRKGCGDTDQQGPATRTRGPFEPSEYTALLIQALHLRASRVAGANVLEIGVGSGVVLRALAALGAACINGVDLEEQAIKCSRAMLTGVPGKLVGTIQVGDMWEPVAGRKFDLIVANLPQFPTEHSAFPTRLPSWSAGGVDGRRLLDRFLDELDRYLVASGTALLTHNGFVDVEQSRLRLAAAGFKLRPVVTAFVHIGPDKLACLSPVLRARFDGRSLHQYGPHLFAEVHVLEIARDLGDAEGRSNAMPS